MSQPASPVINFTDTHLHLMDAAFDPDRTALLQSADRAGVSACVVLAAQPSDWPNIQRFRAQESCLQLWRAYGLHPRFLQASTENEVDQHLQQLEHYLPSACAIGECGLDFSPDFVQTQTLQRYAFAQQIQLAQYYDLPLLIHAVRSLAEVIATLQQATKRHPLRGILHSFHGSAEQAQQLKKINFFVGLGATVTRSEALRLQRMVQQLSLDHIVLETDAPFQAKERSCRNEPAALVKIAKDIAQLKNVSIATLAQRTQYNVAQLFSGTSKNLLSDDCKKQI